MRTTKKTANTSARAKPAASKGTKAAKQRRVANDLRAKVGDLEARLTYAQLWYQHALKHMLTWNGQECRILAPIAAVPLPNGEEVTAADVGLVEPRTGMLIVRVDERGAELAFHTVLR